MREYQIQTVSFPRKRESMVDALLPNRQFRPWIPDQVGDDTSVTASAIAARALLRVGVPFRLKGRNAAGLDCIGLVADAIGVADVPVDYSLRGDYAGRVERYFADAGFGPVSGSPIPGDIVLVRTAPQQLHLMVAVLGGFVHAHAGLGRVVLTPAPSPYPIITIWRSNSALRFW